MDRQQLLSSLAAFAIAFAAVAAGVGSIGQHTSHNPDPVQKADADPIVDWCGDKCGEAVSAAAGATAGGALGAAVGAIAYDTYFDGSEVNATALKRADTNETKVAIHSKTASAAITFEQFSTTFDNRLTDTRVVGRTEGLNAAIQAMNNNKSRTVTKSLAREAVDDYYTTLQINLAKQWNTAVLETNESEFVSDNTTSVSDNFVRGYGPGSSNWTIGGTGKTENLTLLNASNITVQTIAVKAAYSNNSVKRWEDPSLTYLDEINRTDANNVWANATGVRVKAPPNTNLSEVRYLKFHQYKNRWNKVKNQAQAVKSDISTTVDGIYPAYRAGDIGTGELVNPFMQTRYSPENSTGTFALGTLASVGLTPPEGVEDYTAMNVSVNGTKRRGMLLSDNSTQFDVGKTYDPTNTSGTQYLLRPGRGAEKISEPFKIDKIWNQNGTNPDSIQYDRPSYDTANISGIEERLEETIDERKDINARQDRLRDDDDGGPIFGGGNLFGGGSLFGDISSSLVLILIVAIIIIIATGTLGRD